MPPSQQLLKIKYRIRNIRDFRIVIYLKNINFLLSPGKIIDFPTPAPGMTLEKKDFRFTKFSVINFVT